MEAYGFRKRDDEECVSATGQSAALCCLEALSREDSETYTVMVADDDGGYPCAMFGVVPISDMGVPPGWGCAWFLATDGLYAIKPMFLQQCPVWMDHVQRHYPHVINYVHPYNSAGIKWAEWMGYKFHGLETYGVAGEKFFKVVRSL